MRSPRRKLNSAAFEGLSPAKYPPTIVIMERLMPGHMAMHWRLPMPRACFIERSLRSKLFSSF